MAMMDNFGNVKSGPYKTSIILLTAEEIANAPDELPQHIKNAGWEIVENDGTYGSKADRRGVPVTAWWNDIRIPIAFLIKADKSDIQDIGTPMPPKRESQPEQLSIF